jgi:hypothetical protein
MATATSAGTTENIHFPTRPNPERWHNADSWLKTNYKGSNAGHIPYILESNPHPFYSFRGLNNQMRITIACGLDSRSRARFWKNDAAAVRAVRTIQYNNLLFYLLLIVIYYSSDPPSSLITEPLSVLRRDCARLLRKARFPVPVWLIGPRRSVGF